MYCIFAAESVAKMQGNRGKLAAQAGHAYLHAYWDATGVSSSSYEGQYSYTARQRKVKQAMAYRLGERAYKICLVVDTVEELRVLYNKYANICGVSLVTDAGLTVFNEPTTTCLGLGPISEENIGSDIKQLKVYM